MKTPSTLPTLRILSLEDLLPHEAHDPRRTAPLMERLKSEGILRNPPLVIPLKDWNGRMVVLDGANRAAALRMMGVRNALVQVADPDNGLTLKTWNHVLLGADPGALLAALRRIPGLEVSHAHRALNAEDIGGGRFLGCVYFPTGEAYNLSSVATGYSSAESEVVCIAWLNQVVRICRENGALERTNAETVADLASAYLQFSALIVYRALSLETVQLAATSGTRLPAGVTRFVVSRRALRVNYPLSELMADGPLEAKNAALHEWLRARLTSRGVRYYEESTVVFDE